MALPSTIVARCTARILAGQGPQSLQSSGTGFYYQVKLPADPTRAVIMLVTNKHVVSQCAYAQFVLSTVPNGLDLDQPVASDLVQQHTVGLDLLGGALVPHPSASVDLCALVISGAFEQVVSEGREAYAAVLEPSIHLPAAHRAWTRFIEPVVMVGYPNGLWDQVNDMPIVRVGATATHPLVNHNGRPEFVIDMACMPGSSGSPVFLYEDGMYHSDRNALSPGARLALLGVLWGGPQISLEGRIEVRPVPHSVQSVPVMSSPMNLGYVVSADEITVLADAVLRRGSFI